MNFPKNETIKADQFLLLVVLCTVRQKHNLQPRVEKGEEVRNGTRACEQEGRAQSQFILLVFDETTRSLKSATVAMEMKGDTEAPEPVVSTRHAR